MSDFFDSMRRSFADVPIDAANDNAISTTEFLEAAESLTPLFLRLDMDWAFGRVTEDMNENVRKIRERQLAAPAESESLQALVKNELKGKKHTATEGLLWLGRGLDFTAQALRRTVSNPSDKPSSSFKTAYKATLYKHHSWVVITPFNIAMGSLPTREKFYNNLSQDTAARDAKLDKWVSALEEQVKILNEFMEREEAKW